MREAREAIDSFSISLRPRPHVAGYFQKRRFYPPYLKNLRPHVAFLNRMCGRARLEPRHDVIVFENLRFCPSTRIQ